MLKPELEDPTFCSASMGDMPELLEVARAGHAIFAESNEVAYHHNSF
jgi:hypothetical protein